MILEYKGINIFYTDQGKGTAIVLLHGFLENSSMWHPFIPNLTQKNRVVCIDLLGHGKTNCLGYIHPMELMAEAVEAILRHLRLRKYFMIGHSMGGYVALSFAEKNPNTLKGLCLMNSTYEADDDARKALRKRANKMVKTNFENMVRMSFTNLFSETSQILHKTKLKAALSEALKTPIQGYIAGQEGMLLRSDKFKMFLSLGCKKLIILGEKDPIIDVKKLLNETKNTTIETVIFSEGHMSHFENEKEFLQKIVYFIE